jgi:hypothetical protein
LVTVFYTNIVDEGIEVALRKDQIELNHLHMVKKGNKICYAGFSSIVETCGI